MRFTIAAALCLSLIQSPVAAQRQVPPLMPQLGQHMPLREGSASTADVAAPMPSLVRAGVLGGVVGVLLGSVLVGVPLAHVLAPTDDDLSTPGIIIGLQIGQAIGIPAGVHLGNQRRGRLRTALLFSAAAGAVGTALLWTDDFDALFESRRRQVVLITVPLAQLLASIYFARK